MNNDLIEAFMKSIETLQSDSVKAFERDIELQEHIRRMQKIIDHLMDRVELLEKERQP